jgi:pullulanase
MATQIAVFNDNIRDGVKGHVFDDKEKGFVNGQIGFEETIKFGIVAATYHAQIKYPMVANSKDPWANEPYQTINYASAHDNYTLWDKLQVSTDNKSEDNLIAMNKLAAAIILTSQGIPFIQAGEEFARTKVNPDGSLNENSYNAPDSVNKLEWKRKEKYKDLFDYYKGLIKIRKSHKAFKMDYNTDIQDNLKFLKTDYINSVIYTINGDALSDTWKKIVVIFNGGSGEIEVDLLDDEYFVVVNEKEAGVEKLSEVVGSKIKVPANSAYILVNKESFSK